MIRLQAITKSYTTSAGTTRILHDCTVTIPQGSMTAIIGKSGSGKSTLLNILSGIDTPDSGSITIHNTNLHAISERERTAFRRANIGFIFQFFHLLPTLTALENILFQQELQSRITDTDIRHAYAMLESLGIAQKAEHYPAQLSGGEQQRVAIARALIHKPALLLADEPTGNLDPDTASIIMNLLVQRIRAEQQTSIIVTHSMDIARLADNVYEMQHGTLVRLETLPDFALRVYSS